GTDIGALWGRARIADLMAATHRGADLDSVRRAVTATALRHRLVSRYTSLIAVEKKVARPVDEPLFSRDIARNLPDGWVYDKVFGARLKPAAGLLKKASLPTAQTARAPVAVRLPTGATSGPIQILAGIAALLAAAGLLTAWRRR
ncbi:MAG: hypothetical protein V3R85_11970, partial [Alphaproteobacteria bacterium]